MFWANRLHNSYTQFTSLHLQCVCVGVFIAQILSLPRHESKTAHGNLHSCRPVVDRGGQKTLPCCCCCRMRMKSYAASDPERQDCCDAGDGDSCIHAERFTDSTELVPRALGKA